MSAMAPIVADRRLYVDADRARVVEDGDPTAAFLLAPAGTEIGPADVARLGLTVEAGRVVLPGTAKPAAEPAPKPEAQSEPEPVTSEPAPEPKPRGRLKKGA